MIIENWKQYLLKVFVRHRVCLACEDILRELVHVLDFLDDMNKEYDLNLNISGIYPLSSFSFLDDNDLKKTFFIEYMLKQNIHWFRHN